MSEGWEGLDEPHEKPAEHDAGGRAMSDELVERVAREIYHHWPDCKRGAAAAIAAARDSIRREALEEAARECDERVMLLHGQFDVLDITRECDAYRIAAAAIRALIAREPTRTS